MWSGPGTFYCVTFAFYGAEPTMNNVKCEQHIWDITDLKFRMILMTCDRKAIWIFVTNPIIIIHLLSPAHLFELFLKCPGTSEVIAACGLGSWRLWGSRALTLGGEGRQRKAGEELWGPRLASESLESRKTLKTCLQRRLGPGDQTLLGYRVHGQ